MAKTAAYFARKGATVNICMIGAGYVGLVSAACFSDFGWNVTCVEKDARKVDRLNKGEIPIYEPGLEALVAKNARAGRLHFTTELAAVARDADLIFLAVGPRCAGATVTPIFLMYSRRWRK